MEFGLQKSNKFMKTAVKTLLGSNKRVLGSVSNNTNFESIKKSAFVTLPRKRLDRMTESKIEHVICTSALAAFY